MRALTASLTVVLGLAAVSLGLSACSDSTDSSGGGGSAGKTVGEAGEAGETGSTAGANNAGGGGASAGAPGGEAGAAGASACSFESNECRTCLTGKCGTGLVACGGDNACGAALGGLQVCACDGTGIDECKATFVKDGGEPATDVATCYEANCKAACEG